ncbi:hypothetical protein GDO81_008071 [Engystomops pustulosus]|uniref:Uncharacterized protein n=1 Tax=Engystomops pustulosus TaxID=76066 RepID=A0AAV7CCN9_ENGPU|nr:hypothetical protein GDO81_008071 [Engystomops pustulosus]
MKSVSGLVPFFTLRPWLCNASLTGLLFKLCVFNTFAVVRCPYLTGNQRKNLFFTPILWNLQIAMYPDALSWISAIAVSHLLI